jgi:hypothetical protein
MILSQLQTTAIFLHTDEQQVRKITPLAGLSSRQPEPAIEKPETKCAAARSEYVLQRR